MIKAHIKKNRKISSNLTLHLNELEKEEQPKTKVSRREEITKIRVEIYEMTRETTAKFNQTKDLVFEKRIKMGKLLAT